MHIHFFETEIIRSRLRWAVQTMVGIVVKGYFAQMYVVSNLHDVLSQKKIFSKMCEVFLLPMNFRGVQICKKCWDIFQNIFFCVWDNIIEVWNGMRVSKCFHFLLNDPYTGSSNGVSLRVGLPVCPANGWLVQELCYMLNAISYGDSGGTELTSLKLRARCVISNAVGKHKPWSLQGSHLRPRTAALGPVPSLWREKTEHIIKIYDTAGSEYSHRHKI